MTDTDEARRKRSEQARKAALARSPESRREAALKAAATKGPEVKKAAALKSAANRDPETLREALRRAAAVRSPEARREVALRAVATRRRNREATRDAGLASAPAAHPRARGGPMVLKTMRVGAARTSLRLEPEFWDYLTEVARGRGLRLAALVTEVAEATPDRASVASALRVFALLHARRAASRPVAREAEGKRVPVDAGAPCW